MGYLYPEVLGIWSNKNKKSPYEYAPYSNKKVWWKCPDSKHEDYYRDILHSNKRMFRCPKCSQEHNESFLQEKVSNYITQKYNYDLFHEQNCTLIIKNPKTKRILPYDNEVIINNKHLIIEVNGEQHYKINLYCTIRNKLHSSPK